MTITAGMVGVFVLGVIVGEVLGLVLVGWVGWMRAKCEYEDFEKMYEDQVRAILERVREGVPLTVAWERLKQLAVERAKRKMR